MSRSAVISRRSRVAHRTRLSRRIGPMCLLSLAVLLLGWSALWIFARHEALRSVDVWLAQERSRGRRWTCPSQSITGFPLAIVLSCTEPTFEGPVADGVYHGQVAAITAEAQLYFPTRVEVDLQGPLSLKPATGGSAIQIAWSAAQVTLRGEMPGDLDRGQIEAKDVTIRPADTSSGAPVRIDGLTAGLRLIASKSGSMPKAEVTLDLRDARIAAVDAALRNTGPVGAEVIATLDPFVATGPTLPELLEPWRQAGGRVVIKALEFAKGDIRATGTGELGLDPQRRPVGKLDATVSGYEALARAFGLPNAAVQLGGALAKLLGGSKAQADTTDTSVPVSLVAKDGRLWVGPLKTGVALPPLY
jgi:hypothetical protein